VLQIIYFEKAINLRPVFVYTIFSSLEHLLKWGSNNRLEKRKDRENDKFVCL
jgi:hypothetical protein